MVDGDGENDDRPRQEQLERIVQPHAHDVLSGRGNFANHHAGNENFRRLVKHFKSEYVACPKAKKQIYPKIIYDEIRALNPPGRFLIHDPKTKLWSDIGEKKALNKTRQALREGAPEIRELMKEPSQEEKESKPDEIESKGSGPPWHIDSYVRRNAPASLAASGAHPGAGAEGSALPPTHVPRWPPGPMSMPSLGQNPFAVGVGNAAGLPPLGQNPPGVYGNALSYQVAAAQLESQLQVQQLLRYRMEMNNRQAMLVAAASHLHAMGQLQAQERARQEQMPRMEVSQAALAAAEVQNQRGDHSKKSDGEETKGSNEETKKKSIFDDRSKRTERKESKGSNDDTTKKMNFESNDKKKSGGVDEESNGNVKSNKSEKEKPDRSDKATHEETNEGKNDSKEKKNSEEKENYEKNEEKERRDSKRDMNESKQKKRPSRHRTPPSTKRSKRSKRSCKQS
ncbi:hypothetical protein ACHAWF_007139 [Thalassiosira exigua]